MPTAAEILREYQKGERPLSSDFLSSIPWSQAKNHELADIFVPTLIYMRDVEKFTELYYRELAKTKTIRDPHIKIFMEQWQTEEDLHGDLLNRFLEEMNLSSDAHWFEQAKKKIPRLHRIKSKIDPLVRFVLGSKITAVHMTWGAINEYSTLNGYSRLSQLAKHPVLATILGGIMREEARHARFYWRMAQFKLATSNQAQRITRFIIDRFWVPVGQGEKSKEDANQVVRSLYSGRDGIKIFDQTVTSLVKQLPGFSDFSTTTKIVSEIARA